MSEHSVLYIVEGKAEESLLKRMWDRFGIDTDYVVYRYNTNIHVLIDLLFDDDELDEDLEVVRELRAHEEDAEKKELLSRKFEYVYLIFDFDPHDTKRDLTKISRMIDFFDDPADNGRLFLNYPMVESYRHIKSLDDQEFKDRTVSLDTLIDGRYKQIVDEECCNDLKQLNRYTKEMYTAITHMHLRKENYLLNGTYEMMEKEEFLKLTGSELLEYQSRLLSSDDRVSVINTCIFMMVEHKPSLFFT